jgi:hypothetical protein
MQNRKCSPVDRTAAAQAGPQEPLNSVDQLGRVVWRAVVRELIEDFRREQTFAV